MPVSLAPQQGQVVGDEGQGIVDLVRDPGDKLPQGRELLGLHKLALGLFQFLIGPSRSSWNACCLDCVISS